MGQPKRQEDALVSPEASVVSEEVSPAVLVPDRLSRKGWAVVGAVIFLVNLPLVHYYVFRSAPDAVAPIPYRDDFSDPSTVETSYWSSGGHWRVVNGELLSPGVKNNPLWLKAKLPENVAIEFDARSESQEGDIKVEVFGDGTDHASGYVLIHGGWGNSMSIIAKRDEHAPSMQKLALEAKAVAQAKNLPDADMVKTGVLTADTAFRVEGNPFPVQRSKSYRWRIERRAGLIRWLIDGQLYIEFNDPFPLKGPKHDRLGFSSWEAQLFFDNLTIEPL
jgi:hypothetical protein